MWDVLLHLGICNYQWAVFNGYRLVLFIAPQRYIVVIVVGVIVVGLVVGGGVVGVVIVVVAVFG